MSLGGGPGKLQFRELGYLVQHQPSLDLISSRYYLTHRSFASRLARAMTSLSRRSSSSDSSSHTLMPCMESVGHRAGPAKSQHKSHEKTTRGVGDIVLSAMENGAVRGFSTLGCSSGHR